jgi:myo-inositol 2-dehydrogenase/D-chiro-inositol 1-dehydrogenase
MIRAGIIGAGYIAQAHARAYAALPQAHLAVIADSRLDRAERLAGLCQARAVADLDSLLSVGVNVLSVCTPTPAHAELAIAAMRAGVHVLCEKPIARTVAQAEAMIQTAREAGVKFMVGHVSRYEADHRRSKEVVERGDLGQLRMGFQSITGPFPEWSSAGWFADVAQSGGPVVDLAIHSFDYLLWMFGCRATRVCAVGVRGKINVHTYALVNIRFQDGGIGLVEVSWAHPRAQSLLVRTELAGTRGRLHWDYDGIASMQVIRDDAGKRNLVMVGEDSFAAEIADFVRCVEEDARPSIPGEEALEALRIALAALESLETGKAVEL